MPEADMPRAGKKMRVAVLYNTLVRYDPSNQIHAGQHTEKITARAYDRRQERERAYQAGLFAEAAPAEGQEEEREEGSSPFQSTIL